ncbi:MAG: sugar phosphate isomerase/epimerase, partial [Lachnospiraceae bacterium]|nr:sugar phosphate isomerase/epimerase [Lachnospiraceae bacterium]
VGSENMKVLISTGALLGYVNGKEFRLLKDIVPRLDCDGLEFMMYRDWYERKDEAIDVVKSLDTEIPVMHFEKSMGEMIVKEGLSKVVNRFETNCEIAREIGAKKAVFHLWNGTTSDQQIEKNIEAYGELRQISDSYDIELLIENVICNKYNPFCNWNWLIERYPDVSYIFDTKMAAFHGQMDGIYGFDKIDHVKHYHVNDYAGGYMEWETLRERVLPVGAGNIDFEKFFGFLKKIAYDETITLEASGLNRITKELEYDMLNNQVKTVRKLINN